MKHILFVFLCFFSINAFSQSLTDWGKWTQWGEQENGTYLNPIIPADYSDIDCIRVGDDYYAISSTFQFSPGMTVLHSKDLVNWRICGNAVKDLTQIGKGLTWKRMNRYARGIWAGSIRFHNNRFYVFFGTPDEGFFMTSATNPEGPWDDLTPILPEPGWDDCSAFWDENGTACFVGTYFADHYKTYLFRMSEDGKSIDRSSASLVYEGSGREATKIIKVKNWYYLIYSKHENKIGRYMVAKRSMSLMGPYSEEKQLAQAGREAKEPNQGGIVEGKDGNWYFLTHHGTGDWAGRIASLLPVSWVDGWPIIGEVNEDGLGTMKWLNKMPVVLDGTRFNIQRSDEFVDDEIDHQWQWNYQPRAKYFSLQHRKGWLRLKAFKPLKDDDLLSAGNTLTQRCFQAYYNEVTIKMDISKMADGQRSGLCHFSKQSSGIGLVQQNGIRTLEFRKNDVRIIGPQICNSIIWLRSNWGLDGLSKYSYSLDGITFIPFGEQYQMAWGNYRGDRIGIYTFNNKREKGFVDVDYFRYILCKNEQEMYNTLSFNSQ
ncbi:MAG: glycoside hydrolase 43 family protein [Phocaeicola sp.]|nr:glycoside hydrolase 43 family protein [Phocaeicola sp.]